MDSLTQNYGLSAEIERLSKLDKVTYELARNTSAEKFKIRTAKLDEFVADLKTQSENQKSDNALFPKIMPYSETVILDELLNDIVTLLNRYVSFETEHEPRAIALWVIHTYCIDAAYITPILFVTSAEMRSGKSTLLAIIQRIVYKCISASSISPSVLFRLVSKYRPTIICDEADTYLTDKNEDLRGILNAGHSRDTSGVLRTNPDTLEPERFDAFGAKCLSGIKGLAGTIEDRSIIIRMRRMIHGTKKEKLRMVNEKTRCEFTTIQSRCLKFANDSIRTLKSVSPILPSPLNDRAADNWHALFQIAYLAGEKWLSCANNAACKLSGIEEENKSLGIELLEDIHVLLNTKFKFNNAVPTADLIEALCEDDEAPWATFNSKRKVPKINAKQLANILAPYGIKSENNIGLNKLKGYLKSSFQDSFARYLCNPALSDTSHALSAPYNKDLSCSDIT